MKVAMDKVGRLVVPKSIREELGLAADQAFEARVENGQIILEPRSPSWHLEQRGRLTVLVPDGPVAPLTDADVRDALESGRDPEARNSD